MICTIAITFILLASLSGAHPLQDSLLTNASSGAKALAEFESQELVIDPDIANPPEIVVVGESGEFSHSYDTDGEDGRALLIWNHTAGTQLDFPAFPDVEFIDCDDFIYFFQPLLWESSSPPYRVKVIMEYGFDVTGTFKTDESGWDKFRAFVYLITPQNWIPIYYSWLPSINGTPQSFLINLWEHTIDSAWSDLEYPLNDIRLAIGFAPSRRCIEPSTGSEPWSSYTGIVTMTVEGISVKALRGGPAAVEEIEPVHAGYTSRNSYEFFVDVEDAGDGTVYSLSRESGSVSYGTILIRWNERADVLWAFKTNSSCTIHGVAIDVYGDNVYAIGMYDSSPGNMSPILLRWSSDGALTLAKELSLDLSWVIDLEIANDDSIYLTGYRHYGYVWESSGGITEHLIKINHEGTVIWEVTLGTDSFASTSLEVSEEGDVYALGRYSFIKWDQDANLLWNKTGLFYDLCLSPNGSIYTAEATYSEWYYGSFVPHMYLVKRDSDGTVLWNQSIDIHYTETWSEPILLHSMEIATDGSLYMFFRIPQDEQGFRLAKYNSSGIQLWNKSLAPLSNESVYYPRWKMVPGRNGLIHIIGSQYDIESEDLSLRMFVYFDSDYPVDPFNLPETGLVIAFSVIAVLVVCDVVRRRKGLRFRT